MSDHPQAKRFWKSHMESELISAPATTGPAMTGPAMNMTAGIMGPPPPEIVKPSTVSGDMAMSSGIAGTLTGAQPCNRSTVPVRASSSCGSSCQGHVDLAIARLTAPAAASSSSSGPDMADKLKTPMACAPGPVPPNKRCRIVGKTAATSAMQTPHGHALLVHRVYVDINCCDAVTLSDLNIASLKSFVPHRQIMWTYSPWPCDIQGLSFERAQNLLDPISVAFLIAGGVPAQIIKDILSLLALALQGGAFMDMDIFWLGRPLEPKANGYLFPEEPHGRRSGLAMGRTKRYPTLAMMVMPKGSCLAMDLASSMLTHWMDYAATAIAHPTEGLKEWTKPHSGWMWNTLRLKTKLDKDPELLAAMSSPLFHFPFNIKMDIEAFKAAVADTTSVPALKGADLELDYVQPAIAHVALHSVTVNLWARQWDPALQTAVMSKLWTLRAMNLGIHHLDIVRPSSSSVEAILDSSVPHLMNIMGKPAAFTLVGLCFAILESGWCRDLIAGGPLPGTYALGDVGIPDAAAGQGPWKGPPISDTHWVGVVVLLAMEVMSSEVGLCDRNTRQGPLGSLWSMPSATTTAVKHWARNLGAGEWGTAWPWPSQHLLLWLVCHYNRDVSSHHLPGLQRQ